MGGEAFPGEKDVCSDCLGVYVMSEGHGCEAKMIRLFPGLADIQFSSGIPMQISTRLLVETFTKRVHLEYSVRSDSPPRPNHPGPLLFLVEGEDRRWGFLEDCDCRSPARRLRGSASGSSTR